MLRRKPYCMGWRRRREEGEAGTEPLLPSQVRVAHFWSPIAHSTLLQVYSPRLVV